MTYTVTANGKAMYRTSNDGAEQRANEVAARVRQQQPAAIVLVTITR